MTATYTATSEGSHSFIADMTGLVYRCQTNIERLNNMTAFSQADLLAIIDNAVDTLEAKHPKDKPYFAIIRKAVEQLASVNAVRLTKAKPDNAPAKKSPFTTEGRKTLGDLIGDAGEKLFGTEVTEPSEIHTFLPQMRKAVPELPKDDHAAKVAISRAFGLRSDQFEAFSGR